MRSKLFIALLVSSLAAACSNEPTNPVGGESITLTANQAATIVTRIDAFASADPTLRSLADTVAVVVNAGASARRLEVTTESGTEPFYAISLQRAMPGASSSWSTFHVIAFDDPSSPSKFIILGGWATVGSGDAPGSVSGPIGAGATTSLTAHIFSLTGSQVSMWHANAGTVSFNAMERLENCGSFPGPGQCRPIEMGGSFNITGTVAGSAASGQRIASGTLTAVPGIRISP
jgi:hypothetical protein